MKITVYENFSKRLNSTKQPSNGTEITEVRLKENCSLENPVFILRKGYSLSINYVYAFNMYYYVDSIISVTNELIELHCSKDVMASYKTAILNTSAYVIYSQSSYNSDILDLRISMTSKVEQSQNTSVEFPFYSNNGFYVMTCVGSNGGIAQKYAMLSGVVNKLAEKIGTIDDDSVLDNLVKSFGSAFGAVTGLTFIPFKHEITPNSSIYLGAYDTGIVAENLTKSGAHSSVKIGIPWNNNGARRLNESLELYLPYIGTVKLNTELFKNKESITIDIFVDFVTGNLIYLIDNYYKYTTTCGVPVQFSTYTQEFRGSLLGYSGEVFSKITSALSPVSDFISNNIRAFNAPEVYYTAGSNYNILGSNGSFAETYLTDSAKSIRLRCTTFEYTAPETALLNVQGLPLMKTVSLSSLSGFCQCAGASCNNTGNPDDKNRIDSFLNSGFFIE